MKKKNNKPIYIWASDFSNSRGEGILARQYVKDLIKFYPYKIYINGIEYSKIKKKNFNIKSNFFHNYLGPFWGIVNIWFYHLKFYKTIYLNYLPLWNFLIFFLLPAKTILGPITGGANFFRDKSFNSFIRKNFFPFFYRVSINLINNKYKNFLFTTDLLKRYLNDNKNYIFNYCINLFKKRAIKTRKEYDLIFYHRKHKNKNNIKQKILIKKLLSHNLKILIIGDNPQINKSKYLGNLDREKVYKFISKAKYAINNSENILSIFAIDCLSSGTKVINFVNYISDEKFFDTSDLIIINEQKINQQVSKILKILKLSKINKINYKSLKIKTKKKEIENYFLNLDL